MNNKLFALLFFAFLALTISSCKKVTEDQLINGLWRIDEIYVDTISTNYLYNLPHYPEGNNCCAYKIDFERDGTVLAFYVTHDSINYVAPGIWYLPEYNKIYMKVDSFFDGTFDIAKPTLKHFRLSSDANHIKAFDGVNPNMDTTSTKIDMVKI
jgi:hypothetical protein